MNYGKEHNWKPKNKQRKENGVGSTGLEHQGRTKRTQRIPGKEQENWNFRRQEKAGKKHKD
jgi:hypothetical protein